MPNHSFTFFLLFLFFLFFSYKTMMTSRHRLIDSFIYWDLGDRAFFPWSLQVKGLCMYFVFDLSHSVHIPMSPTQLIRSDKSRAAGALQRFWKLASVHSAYCESDLRANDSGKQETPSALTSSKNRHGGVTLIALHFCVSLNETLEPALHWSSTCFSEQKWILVKSSKVGDT